MSHDQLAILGGRPEFPEPIHVGRPGFGDRRRFGAYVEEMIDRRWLTNRGPLVKEFEEKLAAALGVRHCLAVCNGTLGLEIAIRALGLQGEVIVPSFTFIATAHALAWQGLTPVFADIDPQTHNLDPGSVERLITPRTTGIIGVHLWGRPCPVEALQEIADARGLALMFDAAHAFGVGHCGRMIGNFGRAEVFSFHATKFFHSFEGGAIATNDDELAARIGLMQNFGFAAYDEVVEVGTNGKMTEISAAMGLTNLYALEDLLARNRDRYSRYRRELDGMAGLDPVRFDEGRKNNFQYMALEVDAEAAGLSRDVLIKVLHAENILARRYFWPGCHRLEPYRSRPGQGALSLPQTERVAGRILVLPTGSAVSEEDVGRIGAILRAALARGDDIRKKVSA